VESHAKLTSYLSLAIDHELDLVLSPEYSLPWKVFGEFIQKQRLPALGKLWVLGCESITPEELEAFVLATKTIVKWIYEPVPRTSGHFLDVLAYVMQVPSQDGTPTNVILLQFKTQAMADKSQAFERNNLIVGTTTYLINNEDDTIRLISCICSDALGFQPPIQPPFRLDLHPYLVFHPQLNIEPRNTQIRAYRQQMFAGQTSEREVITLNWARNFVLVKDDKHLKSAYGGSAIYSQADNFNLTDERIESNHVKGLYYCNWKDQRTHLCYFNFDEHVFYFRMPKVKQYVAGPLHNRSGPEMISTLEWDQTHSEWKECKVAMDGYKAFCTGFQEEKCDYYLDSKYSALDRERLVAISTGTLIPQKRWYHISDLDSYTAESDERSKRFTFTHEETRESKAFRRKCMLRFIALQKEILAEPNLFPPQIEDLRNDCVLKPPQKLTDYRINLTSKSGAAQGATVMFIGDEQQREAKQLRDSLMAKWGENEKDPEMGTLIRRIVVWYRENSAIKSVHTPTPMIDDTLETPTTITRGNPHE